MNVEMWMVFGIIGAAIILFIWERFSIDTVAILIMFAFVASGILTPEEGFRGFTNPAIITIAAMFVISAAIFQSGALNNVGTILSRTSAYNSTLFLLSLMLLAGVMSAFINDTAVVALLMPVVLKVSRQTGISASQMLMPLSFGALMGGTCTLIGTSTNLLVSGIAENSGLEPFSMFELTRGGIFFLVAGVIYMLTLGRWLLPNRKASTDKILEFNLTEFLTEIKIKEGSSFKGATTKDIPIFQNNEVEPIQLIRDGQAFSFFEIIPLREGDVLKVKCDIDRLALLQNNKDFAFESEKRLGDEDLEDADSRLFEVMVTPNSPMVGNSLSDMHYRSVYDAVVLAIRHREGPILREKLDKVPLAPGDVLLIKARYEKIKVLADSNHILIISEYEHVRFSYRKMMPVLLIAMGAVVLAATGLTTIYLTAPLAVLLLIMLKKITPEEAYRAIDWKVIFMLGGVLSMGTALEKTGGAELIGTTMVNTVGQLGPKWVLSTFFGLSFLLTNVMSNNATAALLAPIAISTAVALNVDPLPFLVAVTFAASLSFMTPMGYQTNTMIYTPGNYRFTDYLRVGTPLNLIFWVLAALILPWLYPF